MSVILQALPVVIYRRQMIGDGISLAQMTPMCLKAFSTDIDLLLLAVKQREDFSVTVDGAIVGTQVMNVS